MTKEIRNNRLCSSQELTTLIPKLERLARRLCADPAAADDLLQETLMRVWQRLRQHGQDDIEDLGHYVTAAMRNLAKRPASSFQELEDAHVPSISPLGPERVATKEVLNAIAQLPAPQADLLLRSALSASRYDDLARQLDVPTGTVMSRLSRARARLRQELSLPDGHAVDTVLGDYG